MLHYNMRSIFFLLLAITITSCTRNIDPDGVLCCVDSTVHEDVGQALHERSRRGILYAGHYTIRDGAGRRSEFLISATFTDWQTRSSTTNAGTLTIGSLVAEPYTVDGRVVYRTVVPSDQAPSDTTIPYIVSGNPAQYIPSFTSDMFVPNKLDVTVEGGDPLAIVDAVDLEKDLTLRWETASFSGGQIRISLSAVDTTLSDQLYAQVWTRVPDTGSYTIPRDSLQRFRGFQDSLDLTMYRPYKKCSCQGGDPYELTSTSFFQGKLILIQD